MAYTDKDISIIHQSAKARLNITYVSTTGKRYIGLANGRLRLITSKEVSSDKTIDTSEKRLDALEEETVRLEDVKDDIVDVDKKLSKLECKLISMSIVLG